MPRMPERIEIGLEPRITFELAGPRAKLFFDPKQTRVGHRDVRRFVLRVIRSVSSVENRFSPLVLPQWHIDNEFRKLLASFEKIIPRKHPSNLQDGTTLTAKLLTRSEGTIGELKTLLAAAATEAMRSGTERFTEEIIDGCNYVPPSTRKQRLARG